MTPNPQPKVEVIDQSDLEKPGEQPNPQPAGADLSLAPAEPVVDTSSMATLTPAQLQKHVDAEEKKNAIMEKYIKKSLKQGDNGVGDYGWVKNGAQKIGLKECLFKPGALKLLRLFKCRIEFYRDDEMWESGGKKDNEFYLLGRVFTAKGQLVGEGRGMSSVAGDKKFNDNKNTLVKMAEKRALLDAVINTFGLAYRFTQDLDEERHQEPVHDDGAPRSTTSDGPARLEQLTAKEREPLGEFIKDINGSKTVGELKLKARGFKERFTTLKVSDRAQQAIRGVYQARLKHLESVA